MESKVLTGEIAAIQAQILHCDPPLPSGLEALERELRVLIMQADKIRSRLGPHPDQGSELEKEWEAIGEKIVDIQMQILHCDQPLMGGRSIGDCFKLHPK